ncbi:MAG TPA: hypothetical protein VIK91_26380 [Nannocystis sp.]
MSEGSVSAPVLVALRCVYGVGDPVTGAPFCPVYAVALPVAQPGALDDDDTYEFAAADLLADLQRRATGRGWSMRVELEIEQTAADAACCDLYAEGPGELRAIAESSAPGGGRRVTLGTAPAHTPDAAVRLAGNYVVRQGAETLVVRLGLTEYEFEA